MSFLNRLHEELNTASKATEVKNTPGLSGQNKEAETHWKKSMALDSSIITDLFQV
jgi:hypothetical protein